MLFIIIQFAWSYLSPNCTPWQNLLQFVHDLQRRWNIYALCHPSYAVHVRTEGVFKTIELLGKGNWPFPCDTL